FRRPPATLFGNLDSTRRRWDFMDSRSLYTATAMKRFLAVLGCLVVAALAVRAFSQPSATASKRLTIEQLIDIRHPSSAIWSPDGRHVAFLSERAGIANIFVADLDAAPSSGRAGARALTRFADGQGAGLFWSADSRRVYFPRQG